MNKDMSEVKVLVWDLDGTLYQSQQGMLEVMHGAMVTILGEHKKLPFNKAKELLNETIKIHKGATKSLQALGCGSRISIIKRFEELFDKTAFLKHDAKLQKLFQGLSSYRHAILSDTTHATIEKELDALGLSSSLFEYIIGVDDAKITKPDLQFFYKLIRQINVPPKNMLMIGDRVEVDLVPAKQLGMKTCLVWGNSSQADISLPTVYDVVQLFTKEMT